MELATETLTILLVEDSKIDARVATRLLQQTSPSSTVVHAGRLEAALEHLDEKAPDVVLLDLGLPDSRGLATLDAVRDFAPHVPVVVFTGQQGGDLGVEAIRRGAQDYIEKGRLEDWLLARVLRYAIERKQAARALQGAQAALEARERRYRALIQHSYDGIVLCEADGSIRYESPSVSRITGYASGELLGRRVQELIIEQDLHALTLEMETLRDQPGGHLVTEHRIFRKDGSVAWAKATITNLLHHPDVAAFVVNFTDVTARKRAEQVRRRLAAIVASSDDAIIGQALDGRITSWNAGAEYLYGYAEEEVAGQSAALLFPPGRSHELSEMLDRLACGAYVRQHETVQVCKDGTRVEVALTMSPIKDAEGQMVGISTIARDITERRRAERAVQESEERLHFALEAGRMGTWEWNARKQNIIWSEETERLYGLEPGEFDGRLETLWSLVHPDDRDRIQSAFERAMESGRYEQEHRIIRSDGERRWMMGRGRAEYDDQGRLLRLVGTVADITERKRAEEALQRSEALNRAVLTNITDAVFITSDDGAFTYVCPNVTHIFGHTRQETFDLGTITELFGFDPMARYDLDGQLEYQNLEAAVLDASGDRHDLLINVRSVAIQEGTILYSCRDITERKRAEEALQRSEALNRAVLRSLNALIAVLDDEGVIVAVNDKWTTQAAATGTLDLQRTGVGVNYLDVCRASAAAGDALAHEALRGIEGVLHGEAPSFTQEYPCPDGTCDRWFRMEVTPLADENGVVVAHHDVTERKEAEVQLIEAKEQAEEMSRLKSAFLANMSHEIRTPLTAVIGFAELLREEVQGDAVELAEMVHRGGERLLTTLNSVLDLAQLESATLELHWHWRDVGAMVQETAETFRSRAAEKGVKLHASVPEPSVWSMIDVGALTRILNNLVSNAVKFTPSGHITLGTMLDGGDLVLWVSDTGVGIGEAFLQHIFEAFSQESTGPTRDYEGTGIGMTITGQLVDLMGGTLDVYSVKGQGSTFVVRLPHRTQDPVAGMPTVYMEQA